MIKKRLLSFLFPILIATSIVIGAASFIIPIYDTNDNATSENAVPTVSKSNAEAYIKETGGYYISVEDALKAANQRTSATNVYVIPGTNPIIETQCEVGNNVTLNFPYEGETITNYENGSSGGDHYTDSFGSENNNYIKNGVLIKKTIDENGKAIPTIKVWGVINIGGYRRSVSPQSATAGPCVVITMEDDSIIDCYGKIYNYGFIKETKDNNNSKINVYSSGTIWQQLVIYDWSQTSANGNLIYFEPTAFPFNYFDAPQISPTINFYAGSLFKGMVWLFGTSAGDMYAEGTIISSINKENGLIMAQNNDTNNFVSWKNTDITNNENSLTVSKSKHVVDIGINGDYNFESFSIDLQYTAIFVPVDIPINSADYFIPFSNFFHLNINEGVININEKVQLLPGSSVTVGKDATVNFNNGFLILESAVNPNNPSQSIVSYEQTYKNTPAEFINNGTVVINSEFGGEIKASSSGTTNSKIIMNNASSISVNEVAAYGSWGKGIPTTTGRTKPTLFTVTDSANGDVINDSGMISNTNLSNNTTYQWTNFNGNYCWKKVEPYYVNIAIEDVGQDGQQAMDVHYVINVNSGGKITKYENATSITVYPGEIVYFESVNNHSSISVDGVIYSDILNQRFTISDSDINILITPLTRTSQIVKFDIEEITQDGYYAHRPTYDVKVITSEGYEQIYNNPLEITVFEGDVLTFVNYANIDKIKENNVDIDDISNYSHTFTSEDENITFKILPRSVQHYDLGKIKLKYRINGGEWTSASNEETIELVPNEYQINFEISIYNTNNENVTDNYQDYTIEWQPTSLTTSPNSPTSASGNYSDGDNEDVIVVVTDELTGSSMTFKVTIKIENECLLPGSLITMADGSSKPIEELGLRDMIKSFSFVTGQYEDQMIIYYKEIKDQLTDVITLRFDDGSEFKIAQFQSLFDMNELEYFEINTENYKDVIGKQVMGYDNGKVKTKTIINTTYEQYQTSVYEIVTSYNYNFVADNILTVEPGIGGVNIFEIDDNLTYDLKQMQQDIATYGLYTYEDFEKYVTEEQFELYNARYFKVAVGKGLITFDYILYLIEHYVNKYSI